MGVSKTIRKSIYTPTPPAAHWVIDTSIMSLPALIDHLPTTGPLNLSSVHTETCKYEIGRQEIKACHKKRWLPKDKTNDLNLVFFKENICNLRMAFFADRVNIVWDGFHRRILCFHGRWFWKRDEGDTTNSFNHYRHAHKSWNTVWWNMQWKCKCNDIKTNL